MDLTNKIQETQRVKPQSDEDLLNAINQDAIKKKDQVRNYIEDMKEFVVKALDTDKNNALTLMQTVMGQNTEITRLKELCKENGINPEPQTPKGPNRAERRKAEKANKKKTKSKKS